MEVSETETVKEAEKPAATQLTSPTVDLIGVAMSPVPELVQPTSPTSAEDTPNFKTDLATAQKELNHIATYLNVLIQAYNKAQGSPLTHHHQLVERIGVKLMTALTFYRQTARRLAIHCRTAQETHQTVSADQPLAEVFKLERLCAELDQLKNAVNKLIPQDYSVFNDLKLPSPQDLVKVRPDIFSEAAQRQSERDLHHRTFCAQIEYEQERRKKVMQEIDVLLKKKKTLQDEVKKRKDSLTAVTKDVDETGKTFIDSLGQKLNFGPTELSLDISEIGSTILEAFDALQNREEDLTPVTDADVEMVDVSETPIVTPEAVSHESLDEIIAREEGEASDEGEPSTSPPPD